MRRIKNEADSGLRERTFETFRGVVYPWECDHMGHMNVRFYQARFDEATWQLFGMLGLTPEYLRREGRGMAAVEQHTRYLKEALPGDLIGMRSRVLEITGKSIRFTHLLLNSVSGEALAETTFTGVHLDTTTRRSRAFDEGLLASMREISGLTGVPPHRGEV
jgi:acyl-CoA thioester hydrolase